MKKIKLSFITVIMLFSYCISAQVAINTDGSPPNTSAILDVSSDTSGILIPRLSKSQRDAIAVPIIGLLIFQTNNNQGFYYVQEV